MMKQLLIRTLPTGIYLKLKRLDYKRTHRTSFEASQAMRTNVDEQGYSYKGFDEKKAIFIHVPKCAGVSINKTLFGNLGGGHCTLEDYSKIFEPKCIRDYFKFTFVRNPWDRLVSAYFFLKKGGFGEKDKQWFDENLSSFDDFDDFVKNWVNTENIWKWHHFRPQHHYILDKRRRVELDFLGYFENINEDFKIIMNKVGIEAELPGSNASKHNSYIEYYTDETKEIARKAYSADINLLGYEFDNSSLQKQLSARKLF